jgi:hypothetical protein
MLAVMSENNRPIRDNLKLFRLALVVACGSVVVTACSGPSFSVPVEDVVVSGSNSGGTICYVKGGASSPVPFASATYSATGTYRDDNPFTDKVVVVIYGRTEPPVQNCVSAIEGADRQLSDPIDLPEDEPTPFVVGGSGYGAELADIIAHDQYWLGARISDNFSLLSNEEIRLEDGRVSVAIW